MSGEPNAIMAAIAEALPMPWTVEVTFRTKAGQPVFTWYAPCLVTAPDQTVAIEIDLGSMQPEGETVARLLGGGQTAGSTVEQEAACRFCGVRLQLIDGQWTANDGTIACGYRGAGGAFEWHEPADAQRVTGSG